MKKRKTLIVVLYALFALAWFGAANPFNLFVRRSENFSKKRFMEIQPGARIEDAVSLLGEPIMVRKTAGLVCADCVAYHFLGDPSPWLLSYEEAWLVVDNRGQVVTVTFNREP